MKTIAFFNNKGGVGKTTLSYHLSVMLARLGWRVLAADLDPQANLTSAFLVEDDLERLWEPEDGGDSVLSAINPILRGTGDIAAPVPLSLGDRVWLLAGDLGLSRFEDNLSDAWPLGLNGDAAALRATTAFYRLVQQAARSASADVAVVDVGPNLGAVNRAAIIAADHIIVPLAADIDSLQGLRNLGPTVRRWRDDWSRVRAANDGNAEVDFDLPSGEMAPSGYVVLQHAIRLDRPVRAYETWLKRIPGTYAEYVLNEPPPPTRTTDDDPNCLATLRNYRSLMPYAQEARKPMFDLKPADGAIGGHQALVRLCYEEFKALALEIVRRCHIPNPP